jgi:spermidine synthase
MNHRVHIPAWKKLMSYFTEVVLEHTTSDYNEELTVSLIQGRLQLSTREAIYSYEDKYDNFFQCFQKMELPDKANVLLLGFGLGSIPFMLENNFDKKYSYTGIEIDNTVIYLASKYVLNNLKSDIQAVQADALVYVSQDTNRYDMIAMDIFISEKIPAPFETAEFLSGLHENLSPNGILIFNRLAKTEKEIQTTEAYFKDIFLPRFPNATYLQVKGNRVLISHKSWMKKQTK